LLLPVSKDAFPHDPNHSHLLVDKFEATIDRHDSLCLVLLQQHWPDLLVDVRIVVEYVEFL
jgi:hypothetical protein